MPYLRWRAPANEMRLLLDGMGINPLVHMYRHTVVHEFVDHVTERAKRKRKNTLRYTVGDTARRCRKTAPLSFSIASF